MIKTLKIKIITNDFQHRALLSTMSVFNLVQNEISELAFKNKEYRKYHVHKIVYHEIKNKYKDFSSQLIVRAIDNVTESYKTKRNTKASNNFKKTSAVVYDERILSFDEETISI